MGSSGRVPWVLGGRTLPLLAWSLIASGLPCVLTVSSLFFCFLVVLSIREVLDQLGTGLPLHAALRVFRDAARGMDFLHRSETAVQYSLA